VFFFACRMSDADAVCQRVFQRPLAELFQGEERYGDGRSITETLDTLGEEIETTPPPDYSGWLAINEGQPAAPAAVSVQANGQTVPPAAASAIAPGSATAAAIETAVPEPAVPDNIAPINGDLLPALDAAARTDNAKPRAAPQRAPLPLKA